MKKNTLLYLDSGLVEKAKKANVNISQLVEETLKQALNVAAPQTAHEYLQRVLAEANHKGAALYGEAHLLPFQIESLKLENVGIFTEFEAKFKKDTLNVVYGWNSSGKSTIVRSILLAFGIRHPYFPKSEHGKITLKLFSATPSISVTAKDEEQENLSRGYRCLIADDILQRTPTSMIPEIFKELKALKIQTIVTTSKPLNSFCLPENTNLLSLKKPAR